MITIKNQTQHQIINRIWTKERFTRQELSKELNLNRSTISRSLEGLMEQSVIIKDSVQNPGESGGRKTEVLKLNENLLKIMAISIVNDRILALLLNLKGRVIDQYAFNDKVNEKNIVEEIEKAFHEFSDHTGDILAVTISMPGIIDSQEGLIHFSYDLNIKNMPLKKLIEEKLEVYTYIENDANAGAAAYLFESGMKHDNLIYYMFSFPSEFKTYGGIGAGIVLNKAIYKGSRSAAGEIILDNSWRYSKEYSLHAKDLGEYVYPSQEFPQIIEDMINNLINRIIVVTTLLDPDKIILGGDITDFSDSVISHLKGKIKDSLDFSSAEEFIEIDTSGINNIALGGAVSFLNQFFTNYEWALKILEQ